MILDFTMISWMWYEKHKQQINKLDFIKSYTFFASKDTIKKVKMTQRMGENVFTQSIYLE